MSSKKSPRTSKMRAVSQVENVTVHYAPLLNATTDATASLRTFEPTDVTCTVCLRRLTERDSLHRM